MGMVLNQLKQLPAEALPNLKLRPRKNMEILLQDGMGHVETGRLRNCQKKDSALQTFRLQSSGDEDIGIHDQSERKHQRFDFWIREDLMIWSI